MQCLGLGPWMSPSDISLDVLVTSAAPGIHRVSHDDYFARSGMVSGNQQLISLESGIFVALAVRGGGRQELKGYLWVGITGARGRDFRPVGGSRAAWCDCPIGQREFPPRGWESLSPNVN